MAILNDDTLNVALNYLPIDIIYKLKLLNKQFNNFIDNEFVLINYYYHKINKNIIKKHYINLRKIIIYIYPNNSRYNLNHRLEDNDMVDLNKLEILINPYDEYITDNGLKYIPNIQHLSLCNNKNITDDGLKYISKISILIWSAIQK